MTLRPIANEDCIVTFELSTGPPPTNPSEDIGITYTGVSAVLNNYGKASAKKIITAVEPLPNCISYTWGANCPHTAAGHTFTSGGGLVSATALYVKLDAKRVAREEDTGSCSGAWVKTSDSSVVDCTCDVEISDAGQDKVKAE